MTEIASQLNSGEDYIKQNINHSKWKKTIISQINEEVKTDALDMTQKSIMSQNNEEVKTDTLDITLITTPEENLLETRETTKIGSSYITDEKLTLPNLTVNENEEIPSNTETVKFEGKEKLYTEVLNETTLRILCQKTCNAASITQDVQDARINFITRFFCICYFCYFFVEI